MKQKEEAKLKAKACNISIKEGSAYSFMDGFGLRYITPYALKLGATNSHIGILSTLPYLVGSISEVFTLSWMKKYSRRTIVFWGVLLQAIMWLVLIGIGALFFVYNFDHEFAPLLIIITFTLLVTFGSFAGPAWSSWMRDIIPKHYNEYFGTRNRITGIVALLCMLVAGYLLDFFKTKNVLLGFGILFFIAFLGRATSASLFKKQYEPKFIQSEDHQLKFWQFMRRLSEDNFGRFTLFISMMSFTVAIASPFFAVYMLKNLNFDYVTYTAILLSSSISTLVFMPAWGKFGDVYGNKTILKLTGYLVPLVPIFWLFSVLIPQQTIVVYLLIVEAFSGVVWAGFNLATADYIYDIATQQSIGQFSAYFSVVNNIGAFIGALLGGLIASFSFSLFGLSSILIVFLLSGVARFIVAALNVHHIDDVRHIKEFGMKEAKEQFKHLSAKRVYDILR